MTKEKSKGTLSAKNHSSGFYLHLPASLGLPLIKAIIHFNLPADLKKCVSIKVDARITSMVKGLKHSKLCVSYELEAVSSFSLRPALGDAVGSK